MSRPRHFHATKAAADDDDVAMVIAAPKAIATADSLHQHALESIFAFLSLGGLAVTTSVSRRWSSAVGTMRSIGAKAPLHFSGVSSLVIVCASGLARHIGAFESRDQSQSLWTAASLQLISARMTNLHHLALTLWSGQSIVLPQKLNSVYIRVASDASADQINKIILCASRLPLLERFNLELKHPLAKRVSFAALHATPLLVEFGIRFGGRQQRMLSDEQVDQVRAMPHVMFLGVELDLPLMTRLLRLPHSLRWQSIGTYSHIRPLFALLPDLPSLTRLSLAPGDNDDVSVLLQQLPNLRDLYLDFVSAAGQIPWTKQLAVLQQSCTRLTSLRIMGGDFSATNLCALLPCITDLRTLWLWRIKTIDSLRFLSRGPIVRTLTDLTLGYLSPQLHNSEMLHVNELRELRCLSLQHLFVEPLEPLTRLFYSRAPSRLLPKLTSFQYNTIPHFEP